VSRLLSIAFKHRPPVEAISVGQLQCPVCYTPLEVRDVTPCFVCGGWPEAIARFNLAAEFTEFRLPRGQTLLLCRPCALEEFLVPGGWGYRLAPDEKFPFNALQPVRSLPGPHLVKD
jgi:hypothetical protein